MEDILEIRDLTKAWPGFRLEGVTFSVPAGSVVGLIGENGAGKTTLINLILNAFPRDGGQIRCFGMDNVRSERQVKQLTGVVQDECNLPGMFTAADVETVMRRVYRNWDSGRYRELVGRFGLDGRKTVAEMSKGMKVKLNFAVALAHGSRMLLLDEATGSLDPVMRDEVLDLLLDFVQDEGRSVLFSTHQTSDLEKIADYAAFLHRGRLVFFRQKDELIYKYGVMHCGEAVFRGLDRSELLAYRRMDYEYRVLVPDREAAALRHREAVVDPATLEDIMLLYIRGEAV